MYKMFIEDFADNVEPVEIAENTLEELKKIALIYSKKINLRKQYETLNEYINKYGFERWENFNDPTIIIKDNNKEWFVDCSNCENGSIELVEII